ASSCVAGVQYVGGGGRAGGNRGADRKTQRIRIPLLGVSGGVSVAVLHPASKPAIPAPDRSGGVAAGGGGRQQTVWSQRRVYYLKSRAAGERITKILGLQS